MSGDREALFRNLWRDERSVIVAYALRRTRSYEDAAEVVAETFLVAWRRIDFVPPAPEARLWLYATARKVISNQQRGERRRRRLAERVALELRRAEVVAQPLDERALSARRRFESLREADREILMLAAWEGLQAPAIGRVLGCSTVAARIRLHRARSTLRDASHAEPLKHPQGPGHLTTAELDETPEMKA